MRARIEQEKLTELVPVGSVRTAPTSLPPSSSCRRRRKDGRSHRAIAISNQAFERFKVIYVPITPTNDCLRLANSIDLRHSAISTPARSSARRHSSAMPHSW